MALSIALSYHNAIHACRHAITITVWLIHLHASSTQTRGAPLLVVYLREAIGRTYNHDDIIRHDMFANTKTSIITAQWCFIVTLQQSK